MDVFAHLDAGATGGMDSLEPAVCFNLGGGGTGASLGWFELQRGTGGQRLTVGEADATLHGYDRFSLTATAKDSQQNAQKP